MPGKCDEYDQRFKVNLMQLMSVDSVIKFSIINSFNCDHMCKQE